MAKTHLQTFMHCSLNYTFLVMFRLTLFSDHRHCFVFPVTLFTHLCIVLLGECGEFIHRSLLPFRSR